MTPRLAVYTVAEVAALLRVCERTVRRLIDSGELRPCRRVRGRTGQLSRSIRIPESEVRRLLDPVPA